MTACAGHYAVLHTQEVTGSSPAVSTKKFLISNEIRNFFAFMSSSSDAAFWRFSLDPNRDPKAERSGKHRRGADGIIRPSPRYFFVFTSPDGWRFRWHRRHHVSSLPGCWCALILEYMATKPFYICAGGVSFPGRTTRNTVPSASRLRTVMLPPRFSVSCLTMANPRPWPWAEPRLLSPR